MKAPNLGFQNRPDELDEGAVQVDGSIPVVLDAERSRSFLILLEAQTMEERARAAVPEVVTLGFHGNFFAN